MNSVIKLTWESASGEKAPVTSSYCQFTTSCVDNLCPKDTPREQRRPWSGCVDSQADLSRGGRTWAVGHILLRRLVYTLASTCNVAYSTMPKASLKDDSLRRPGRYQMCGKFCRGISLNISQFNFLFAQLFYWGEKEKNGSALCMKRINKHSLLTIKNALY